MGLLSFDSSYHNIKYMKFCCEKTVNHLTRKLFTAFSQAFLVFTGGDFEILSRPKSSEEGQTEPQQSVVLCSPCGFHLGAELSSHESGAVVSTCRLLRFHSKFTDVSRLAHSLKF